MIAHHIAELNHCFNHSLASNEKSSATFTLYIIHTCPENVTSHSKLLYQVIILSKSLYIGTHIKLLVQDTLSILNQSE